MDSARHRNRSRTQRRTWPFNCYNLSHQPTVAKEHEDRLRAGGLGYGDLKKAVFDNYWNYFAKARAHRAELAANLDYVHQVLAAGAAKARALAQQVLKRAKVASGLI